MKMVWFTCPACGISTRRRIYAGDHLMCTNYDCKRKFSGAELDEATAPVVKWPSEYNDLKQANSSLKTAGKALRSI